jgi:hypothetical protein
VRNDGLRFDFSLPRPMKQDEIVDVEAVINRWIEVRPCNTRHTRLPCVLAVRCSQTAPSVQHQRSAAIRCLQSCKVWYL